MLHGLFIASIIGGCCRVIKEAFIKPIPGENWANKELVHEDIMNGNSDKLIKNAQNGKYIVKEKYPEPHRDPETGQVIIENCELWREDYYKYGGYQVSKWAEQGKYNLTPEELKIEDKRLRKKYGLE